MKYSDYNEKKQHGAPDFPIQLYRADHSHPQYVMPLHWHKELEIIRVLSGRLTLFVNNIKYELSQGDIAFVSCGFLHHGEPNHCVYECIVCDLAMLTKKSSSLYSSYIDPLILSLAAITPLPDLSEELTVSIHTLFDILAAKSPYFELNTAGQLLTIIGGLYQNDLITRQVSAVTGTQTHRITALVQWIERNHSEVITLSQLATLSGLSPNYLCRIFKEYTGKTPMEYINFVRIEHVCHELRSGQTNITEAAENNGFNDISYFCKVFKKHMGLSAKQYLKK